MTAARPRRPSRFERLATWSYRHRRKRRCQWERETDSEETQAAPREVAEGVAA